MGIDDLDRVYRTEDLAPGKNVIFAAAGVTDGALLKGVRFFGDGIRTHCLVMTTVPHQVRFIDTIHAKDGPDRSRSASRTAPSREPGGAPLGPASLAVATPCDAGHILRPPSGRLMARCGR